MSLICARGDDRNVAAIDLELTTYTFKSTLKLDTNLDQILKVGILGSYQNNFANPDTGIRRLIPDYSKFDLGLFTIGNFKLHDKLVFDLGIRYDFSRIDAKKFYQILVGKHRVITKNSQILSSDRREVSI